MGSGDWFKSIINLRKSKEGRSKKAKGSLASQKQSASKLKNYTRKESSNLANDLKSENLVSPGVPVETIAATMIQTAFRAYMARKSLRRLKGLAKIKIMTEGYNVKNQANRIISYLHQWSEIQAMIRARRICMVTEDKLRRKKLESQLKLEAKLHDFEVEWSGGSDTMEETLARIHQREEASVKRERAMAYAFSHQWRANSSQSQVLGNYELGKANWGWSWKERWIAARPWESRVPYKSATPKKSQNKQPNSNKVQKDKNSSTPKSHPVSVTKPPLANNARGTLKPRRLSYPPTVKATVHDESSKS